MIGLERVKIAFSSPETPVVGWQGGYLVGQ